MMRWCVCAAAAAVAAAPAAADNPVVRGGADPTLKRFGDRYYLYATDAGATEPGFAVWSSADLADWRNDGMALRLADTGWARRKPWAPDCVERAGKFYLYFAADDSIGVGVADAPTGPFKDALGKPLVARRDDLSAIDPMAFVDDDGKAYLYWGAVPASWLRGKADPIRTALSVRPLAADMTSFAGPERATVAADGPDGPHIEGSFVVKRAGTYHLMYSEGNWDAPDDGNAYRVRAATAPSPLGPWAKRPDPVMRTNRDAGIVGPGHHSVVRLLGPAERWVICYHAHAGDARRNVFLDRLTFAADGSVAPVTPTRAGVGRVAAGE